MVKTASTMLPLSAAAPGFSLPNVLDDSIVTLKDFDNKRGLLVMFVCNHCPFVVHVRKELAQFGKDYRDRNVGIVAISSNDAESYPDDTPAKLKEMATRLGFTFPLLYDESQKVAIAYSAACTPDFFLFNEQRRLIYRGQLDGSRPGNDIPVTGSDLRQALDAFLEGRDIDPNQKPSIGCNIKWKPGNEPDYFKA